MAEERAGIERERSAIAEQQAADLRQLMDTDLATVRAMVETLRAAKAMHNLNGPQDMLQAVAPSQGPTMLPRARAWLRALLARL